MRKRAVLAAAIGILTASCSGGHSASTIPAAGAPGAGASGGMSPSSLGARTTRANTVATAPSGWAATATGAIALANATDLGQLDGNKPVNVVLALQMRNVDAVKAAIAARQIVSRSAFVSQYAPSSAQVAAATAYLQQSGFTNITPAPNNMLVTASASAAAVQKAFNTTLHAFSVGGKPYYANTQPAFVPTSLGGNVVAVLGLTNAPGFKASHPSKPAPGVKPAIFDANGSPSPNACTKGVNTTTGTPVCPRFYDPATFNIAYNAGSTPPATNTEIGIFTIGDVSGSIADLRENETQFGMPQIPVDIVHAQPQTADVSGQSEWTLDMTYAQGMAYSVQHADIYNVASLSYTDLTRALNRWASDDIAPVMNASVGGCEVFPYQ
ncbi:MAG TPA: protease pro-enzyme activation domain-containing protein, partial [Candidatus Elarobacter sp.]